MWAKTFWLSARAELAGVCERGCDTAGARGIAFAGWDFPTRPRGADSPSRRKIAFNTGEQSTIHRE